MPTIDTLNVTRNGQHECAMRPLAASTAATYFSYSSIFFNITVKQTLLVYGNFSAIFYM